MVRIGRCTSCGRYMSEVFTARDNCPSCGGAVDHIDEEMGPISHISRIFNVGGLALIILSVMVLLLFSNDRGISGGGTASLILVLSGIFFFVLSLVSQLLLTRGAISSHRSRKIQPRRKAREGNRSTGRKIISGKIR
ncbi:hypothetical protein B6U90_05505 [Thermoplasmatales archaeon ex4484_6]|nr:MAG: hypothetical protein B6U90_05505 [Thermoplasmatales archaeon ex4484_6]RLF69547.1 MAG: hypothetical protein DRN57_00420 [Thermoplasmata archaeon]